MRKLLLFTAVIAMTASSAFAQEQIKRCNTSEYMQQMFLENPGYKEQLQQLDEFTNEFVKNNPTGTRTVVTIPVVVHVVYNTTAENISDALVNSQMAVLNEDFRRLNVDANETPAVWLGVAADCEINFCLAARDPSGNATNGITRTSTTKTSFSNSGNPVKFASSGGHDVWDRTKYLNIWVCDLSGGLLGYAQFPGGPANTDGVVIDYQYTGLCSNCAPYQYGRSATHEVGHWLNLYHIWGDDGTGCNGSDQVADTPNQADETYQCPLPTIRISCTNGPNGDMYSNYMDYTDDGCMNIFTTGQKTRMQALFSGGGSRVSILTSDGCVPPGGGGTCNIPASLSATAITTTTATLNWGAATGALSYNIQYKPTSSGTWLTTTSASTSVAVSSLSSSSQYEFQVESVCSASTSGFSASTNFNTSAPACTDIYETNNNLSNAKPIPVGVIINGLIAVSTDKDFFSFANTVAESNIHAHLSSMPANYNLDLYNPSGVKIFASKKSGTTDEDIIYNTSVVGTYKLKVYPSGGAFNGSDCYDLLAQIGGSPFRTVEIAEVVMGGEMTNLYPNPSNGNMVVEYNSISNSAVQLIAYDMMGKMIFSEQTFATEGNNSFSVNISNISNGIYLFEIRNGNETSRMKFSVNQ